jgi:hypothetical protein
MFIFFCNIHNPPPPLLQIIKESVVHFIEKFSVREISVAVFCHEHGQVLLFSVYNKFIILDVGFQIYAFPFMTDEL